MSFIKTFISKLTGPNSTNIYAQERLLEAEYRRSIAESSGSFWPSFILVDTLRIVFQNLLLESNQEILQCSERVWRLLLEVIALTSRHRFYSKF